MLGQKHRLENFEERKGACHVSGGKELPVVEGAVTATTGSSFLPRWQQAQMKKCRRLQGRWNADLEGGMEKLAVEGAVSGAANRSKNPDGKSDHWPPGAVSTPSSDEVGGDFIMCEVEEQQAARVDVLSKNESSDSCGISQKEVEEIGFVPSASSEPGGATLVRQSMQ